MIEVCVPKVLGQVVDEEVASLGALLLWGRLLLLQTEHTAVGVCSAVLLESRGVAMDGTGRGQRYTYLTHCNRIS